MRTVCTALAAGFVLAACASTPAYEGAFDRDGALALTRSLSSDALRGRLAGSPESAVAQDLITSRMEAIGLAPVGDGGLRHPFTYGAFVDRESGETARPDKPGVNLIGRIDGIGESELTLVITAHYDHLGVRDGEIYNGADDNAAGVAGLIAIAEHFAANPPRHTVVFAALDAEEAGFGGARNFMASPPLPLSDVAMNINLDMISRSDGEELWISGVNHTPGLLGLAEQVIDAAAIPMAMGYDGADPAQDDWTNLSDHVVFYQRGIPHIYLGVEDHVDYHKPGDDFDKIGPTFYLAAVDAAIHLAELADEELAAIAALRRIPGVSR